jgi:hypothetical protein
MLHPHTTWSDTLIRFVALASRLEREGQYNVAKLARASADAMVRQAAYALDLPPDRHVLAQETEDAAGTLSAMGLGDGLAAALGRGAAGLREGRFTMIDETPDASVCRTCGFVAMGDPTQHCPICGAWPETFQRFLPVYWLNDLEPLAAIERLRQTSQQVSALIGDVPESTLGAEPVPGEWSVRNAVTHLRDAQGVLAGRLELMLAQSNPALTPLAVFDWAQNEANQPPSTREIFAEYMMEREKLLARLETLPLIDWWRTGKHEEFGTVTIRQQVSYFAAHESTHLVQIEQLVIAGG